MPIKYRSQNSQNAYTDYKHLTSNYNDSSFNNPSHKSNEPTNFNLKEITFEDCDMAVYEEFNKRFRIANHYMGIILLDAELVSIHYQNYEQFDSDKTYLNFPFFTMFRKKAIPKYRTSPAFKPVVYVVPKYTEGNELVYEEWITEGPLCYDLIYEFKFITYYREYTNEMEQQMRYYFRNKRNIIVVQNDRFSIGPNDYNTIAEVEIVNRESVDQKTLYVSTFELKLDCWTRSLANMQKRERPNKFVLDISVTDAGVKRTDAPINLDRFKAVNSTGLMRNANGQLILVDRFQKNTTKFPTHPSPGENTLPLTPGELENFKE